MSYTRWQTTWRNDPSGATPAPAAFFQYLEDNNVAIDARVTTLETSGGGGGGAVSSVAGRTGAVTLTKTDVGLINVDNTSDVSKPVSTLQTTAINTGDALAIPKSLATTKGDILGASASSVIQRLPVGTNGQVLTANSSAILGVDWETPTGGSGGGIPTSTITTKGDIIVANGSGVGTRLPRGTDGYGLTANSVASNGLGVLWTPKLYQTIQANGTPASQQPTLNFLGAVSVANNPGNASTDVTIGGAGASITVMTPDSNNVMNITSPGTYRCNIPSNTNPKVMLWEPPDDIIREVIIFTQITATVSSNWTIGPGTIAWDTGLSGAPYIYGPTVWDTSPGSITVMRLLWMGTAYGWTGTLLSSIPAYYFNPSQTLSLTNTEGLGKAGNNVQALNLNLSFPRPFPVYKIQWSYNALTQCFSAAMRQRLLNNGNKLEVTNGFATDGVAGSTLRGSGGLDYSGWTSGDGKLCVMSLQGVEDAQSAKGGICHEMCHSIERIYYGGANPAHSSGISHIPDQPGLASVYTDCVNNGGPSNNSEWFAELLRHMFLGDNGDPNAVPPTMSMAVQLGTGTSPTTPAQRYVNFVSYINSLSLV